MEKATKRLDRYLENDRNLKNRLPRAEFVGGNGHKPPCACRNWAEIAVLVEEMVRGKIRLVISQLCLPRKTH